MDWAPLVASFVATTLSVLGFELASGAANLQRCTSDRATSADLQRLCGLLMHVRYWSAVDDDSVTVEDAPQWSSTGTYGDGEMVCVDSAKGRKCYRAVGACKPGVSPTSLSSTVLQVRPPRRTTTARSPCACAGDRGRAPPPAPCVCDRASRVCLCCSGVRVHDAAVARVPGPPACRVWRPPRHRPAARGPTLGHLHGFRTVQRTSRATVRHRRDGAVNSRRACARDCNNTAPVRERVCGHIPCTNPLPATAHAHTLAHSHTHIHTATTAT